MFNTLFMWEWDRKQVILFCIMKWLINSGNYFEYEGIKWQWQAQLDSCWSSRIAQEEQEDLADRRLGGEL